MKGYVDNIEQRTIENDDFRRVLYTGKNIQRVLMTLKPGEEIGEEVHEDRDQFFRVEEGQGEVRIELSPSKIRVSTARVVLTSKLIDGTFPDYERVIPQGNDKKMEVDNAAFAQAVDRVSTLSSDKGRAVKLTITDGKLVLSVNNPDSGSATEELPVEYGFDPLEIGFNARYLLDISGQLESGTAEFQLADPGSPTMVRDGKDVSALYVLMPMRV